MTDFNCILDTNETSDFHHWRTFIFFCFVVVDLLLLELSVRATTRTRYMMTSPKFQHGAQTKGHDLGSLFSSLLRPEMPFYHCTLGAVPLNDSVAHYDEKKKKRN